MSELSKVHQRPRLLKVKVYLSFLRYSSSSRANVYIYFRWPPVATLDNGNSLERERVRGRQKAERQRLTLPVTERQEHRDDREKESVSSPCVYVRNEMLRLLRSFSSVFSAAAAAAVLLANSRQKTSCITIACRRVPKPWNDQSMTSVRKIFFLLLVSVSLHAFPSSSFSFFSFFVFFFAFFGFYQASMLSTREK